MRSARLGAASVLSWIPLAAVLAGCGGGDPTAEARRVRDRLVAEDPEHRRFDLDIARGATDPIRRQQVIAAIGDETFSVASLALDVLASDPPPEARDALRQVFQGKTGVLKMRAALALGHLGDDAALAFLREQLSDPSQTLVPDAIRVLADHGGESVVGPIVDARMASETLSVREEAYAALAGIGQPWATDRLIRGLEREHGEERRAAIDALGRTRDPRFAPAVERFVNTKGLVFVTLEALGALGNPESASAVRSMLESAEPAARAYAAVSLWRLGGAEEAEPVVAALVREADVAARAILAEEIVHVDDPKARAHLATLARDPERTVRLAALRSIAETPQSADEQLLLDAANDTDYQIQTVALAALARSGDREAVAAIRPLLEAANPYVALAASHATVEILARSPAG